MMESKEFSTQGQEQQMKTHRLMIIKFTRAEF
jgi:hypothetical protein